MIVRYLLRLSLLRHALNLWVILAIAVSLKLAIMGGDYSVYRVFAGGSRHWWADESLYISYAISEALDSFRYSPAFAVAFTPFYLLGDPCGAIAWNLVSVAALVCGMRILVRDVLPGDWTPNREAAFLVLVMVCSIVGIWSLQTNAIVTALLALSLSSIVRGRWWTAALCLAVPVFIKLWPIALVMLLVVFWPRQLSWRFIVVCLGLLVVPFFTKPPSTVLWQYHEWYVDLTGPLQNRWPGYRDAWTIWECVGALLHFPADWNSSTARRVYMAIQLATSAAVLGWCVWQSRVGPVRSWSAGIHRRFIMVCDTLPLDPCDSTESGDEAPHFKTGRLLTLIFAMWASWQLLFGPATEQLTYGIIAPAVSWAVIASFAERKARCLTLTAWAIIALLPAGDIEQQFVNLLHDNAKVILPLGVILFVGWLIRLRAHGPRRSWAGEDC